MRRAFLGGITMLLGLGLVTAPVAAQGQAIERIELPDGWAPEGITTDGTSLFVGSLADGAIWQTDPTTGEGRVLVPGVAGTVAVGVEHEAGSDRLWVAGGATGEVRAYDAISGALLASYAIESGFLNDAVVTAGAVYVTDSFMPQIVVIPLRADGSLPDPDAATALPISGDLDYSDGFNVNGIVATPEGLVVVHSGSGRLYRVDPVTGVSARIDIGDVTLAAGDGLELDGRTLYVVRNQFERVVVLELDEAASSATEIGKLSSDDLDVPATAALVDGDLWAVNARFGTAVEEGTAYWITRLDTADAASE